RLDHDPTQVRDRLIDHSLIGRQRGARVSRALRPVGLHHALGSSGPRAYPDLMAFKWLSRRRKPEDVANAPLPGAHELSESGARLPMEFGEAREPTPDYIEETVEPPEELWKREQELYSDKQDEH